MIIEDGKVGKVDSINISSLMWLIMMTLLTSYIDISALDNPQKLLLNLTNERVLNFSFKLSIFLFPPPFYPHDSTVHN